MGAHHRKARHSGVLKVALAISVAFIVLSCDGPDELELEQKRYCEMVELFISSKGENGWPDYENTYAESCTTQKEEAR